MSDDNNHVTCPVCHGSGLPFPETPYVDACCGCRGFGVVHGDYVDTAKQIGDRVLDSARKNIASGARQRAEEFVERARRAGRSGAVPGKDLPAAAKQDDHEGFLRSECGGGPYTLCTAVSSCDHWGSGD